MSTLIDQTHDGTPDASSDKPEPALEAAFLQATADLIAHAQTNDALAHTLRQLAQALLAALPEADGVGVADVAVNNVAVADVAAREQTGGQPTVSQPKMGDKQDAGIDASKDIDARKNDDAPVVEPASAADIDHLLNRFGSQTAEVVSAELTDETAYDPQRIASHLRLKARACRWLEHHALTDDVAALDERHALISEAKKTDCLLWMFNRDYVNPQNPQLADVADLLDLTADTMTLWEDGYNEPEGRDIAQLVATVQSALRLAVTSVNSQDNWFDSDQKVVYQELKYYGEREQHYLPHMRLTDGADPAKSADYRQQYDALQAAIEQRRDADKQRQSQRNKLRYHVSKLLERPHNANHQWQSVLASLEPFWQGDDDRPHLPADIRDDVRPLLDLHDTPELDDEERDYLETISAVFEDEILAANASSNAAPVRDDAQQTPNDTAISDTAISDEVRRLEPYVAGRTIVIIGGDPRANKSAALEQYFNCRIDWIKTTSHQSIYDFTAKLIRDDVVLVALLIRWSSHVFGEVKSACDKHDKLLVRLPRGYGVNMFAHEVLSQVGERLGA
jgi:hypothetical protein